MIVGIGGLEHSAVLRTLPLSESLNRRWLANARTNFARQTSHIPGTLGVIVDFGRGGMRDDEL